MLNFTHGFTEVNKPADYPTGTVYVIQLFESRSIYHEGDERSRTCPGHGYPAYTETFTSVKTYATKSEQIWIGKLKELYQADLNRKDVAAFKMTKVSIGTSVDVKLTVGE